MPRAKKTTDAETRLKVLLLDNDSRDAERVESALQRADVTTEVRHAETADAFTEALDDFQPDVVLADRGVDGLPTVEALEITREHAPEAPFIVLASSCERETVIALRSGAADFVSKMSLDRLPDAISEAIDMRAPLRRLSRRQREVFRLLASGVPMREIAQKLGLSRKTVETHRAQVMARLGVHHVTEMVRHAIRLGVVAA
jgi:DNA-binding NarL/FixJ family response regulator